MEEVSGEDLSAFFEQWIFKPGQPALKHKWKQVKNKLLLTVSQTQKGDPFHFPLEVELKMEDGNSSIQSLKIKGTNESFDIKVKGKVSEVIIDPGMKLLFEAE